MEAPQRDMCRKGNPAAFLQLAGQSLILHFGQLGLHSNDVVAQSCGTPR